MKMVNIRQTETALPDPAFSQEYRPQHSREDNSSGNEKQNVVHSMNTRNNKLQTTSMANKLEDQTKHLDIVAIEEQRVIPDIQTIMRPPRILVENIIDMQHAGIIEETRIEDLHSKI